MRVFFFLAFICLPNILFAQMINIRTDSDNLNHNSAILSDAMLNIFGEKQIEDWLIHRMRFQLNMKIDNLGKIISVEPIRSFSYKKLSSIELSMLTKYLNSKQVTFPYSVSPDGVTIDKAIKLANELYSINRYFLICVEFPGEGYHEMKLLSEDLQPKRKVYYLKQSIQKYKTPTIREAIINNKIQVFYGRKSSGYNNKTIHYDSQYFDMYDEISAMADERVRFDAGRIEDLLCSIGIKVNPNGHIHAIANKSKTKFLKTAIKQLSHSYSKKYGCTDFFAELCLQRIR